MATNQYRRPGQSRSLLADFFAPVNEDRVLIADESIIYDERRHWAILIQPLLETLAVLLLITAISGGRATSSRFLAVLVLAAAGLVVYRIRSGDWTKRMVLVTIIGLFVAVSWLGEFTVAFLAIVLAVGRFWFRVLFWFAYERLYITNRRIIIATSFLGSEISTMPLTRVTDISYKTTVLADLLGYGILRVETAGQDQALSLIRFLEKPDLFKDTLIERTTAAVGSVTEHSEEDEGGGTREA